MGTSFDLNMSDIEILTTELIAAFRNCDDTQFVTTANDGLAQIAGAVQKRNNKYQDLIREMTSKVDVAQQSAHRSADVVDKVVYDARVKQQRELEEQINVSGNEKETAERA